jgi:hypothetical protein
VAERGALGSDRGSRALLPIDWSGDSFCVCGRRRGDAVVERTDVAGCSRKLAQGERSEDYAPRITARSYSI